MFIYSAFQYVICIMCVEAKNKIKKLQKCIIINNILIPARNGLKIFRGLYFSHPMSRNINNSICNLNVKLSLYWTKYHDMKTYEAVEVQLHVFLTSALDGGEWSTSRPGCFTAGEIDPSSHWIGGWVGPKVGLDRLQKRHESLHCSCWESNVGHPACSLVTILTELLHRICPLGRPPIGDIHFQTSHIVRSKYVAILLDPIEIDKQKS
jgi:hypothetical protein